MCVHIRYESCCVSCANIQYKLMDVFPSTLHARSSFRIPFMAWSFVLTKASRARKTIQPTLSAPAGAGSKLCACLCGVRSLLCISNQRVGSRSCLLLAEIAVASSVVPILFAAEKVSRCSEDRSKPIAAGRGWRASTCRINRHGSLGLRAKKSGKE